MASSNGIIADRVLRKFQRGKPVKFPLNEEVTTLAVAPSGRFICAGFTDGTVRLFDMTGHFHNKQTSKRNGPGSPLPRNSVVDSKRHQRYGAVTCQIHAKGVHTSLRMHVELSEDGLWCFAGALRGSMELISICLADLQAVYDRYEDNSHIIAENEKGGAPNLLDHITVYRHSDAKLRGFGACTRLQHSDRYLLFTGKSIKNIHIWSFDPPTDPGQDPVLVQLYDTSSNGNTISLLQFRRHAVTGALQAISKSVDQRLRVWDLSAEEEGEYDNKPEKRPNRPPFQDVPNTEGTLAVAGGLCICGGSSMYNQMSLVSLNVDNFLSEYNHTEMALPGVTPSPVGSSRRMQRGDLKNVVEAYGNVEKANHVILEISDGTLGHYREGKPQLRIMDKLPWYPNMARTMTVGHLPGGWPVAVVALYQAGSGRGQLSVWSLETPPPTERVKRDMLEASIEAKIDETALVSTSPDKADERSSASTMATTPESHTSRHMEQQSVISGESKGNDSKASVMKPPEITLTDEAVSVCTSEIESVQPAKLARRFSKESRESKLITRPSSGDQPKMSRRPSSELKTRPTDSSKAPHRKSSDSTFVPTKPVQKLARRSSSETNIERSKKTAHHLSNGRPHSAPPMSEVDGKKWEPSKSVGATDYIPIIPKKPVAVRPIAPLLQVLVPSAQPENESKHGQSRTKSPHPNLRTTKFAASRKHFESKSRKQTTSVSKPRSPSDQPIFSYTVARAPKADNQRPWITPTPSGKKGVLPTPSWQHFSIDSAAQTLSSLKKSPGISTMAVDTPLLPHRLEATSTVAHEDEINNGPPLSTGENPLPIPRILHPSKKSIDRIEETETRYPTATLENQNRVSTPPQDQKDDFFPPSDQAYCVTPLSGSKRKSTDGSTAVMQTASDQSPLDESVFERSYSKRQKTDDLEWLGAKISLPGRRDGQQMRHAIAKECARQRRAIDQRVNSLPTGRASGTLGQLEKLLAEQRAASIFLEKKVWRSVKSLLQSLERSPSIGALKESEVILSQILNDYKNTAKTMLARHEYELSSVRGVVSPSRRTTLTSESSFDVSMLDKILDMFPRVG